MLRACWFQKVARTVQFTDFSRNTLQTPCHYVQCADDNFKMLRIPSTCRVWASESRKNNIQFTSVNFRMLRTPCGLPVIVANVLQRLCDALNFVPVCRTYCASSSFWFLNAASILQCTDFLLQSAVKSQRSCQIWFQILQMPFNLPMLASHCCEILSDGKAPRNELMLHHTRQCTGARWIMPQIRKYYAA